MSSESVTKWLQDLRGGDDSHAAQKLWERYLARLLGLARGKLGVQRSAVVDEDDVVAEAFAGFFRAMKGGQFAELNDRHDLWQILVMLTERRVIDQVRRERAAKRNAVPDGPAATTEAARLEHDAIYLVTDGEPTPAFAAEVGEELQILLNALPNTAMREIALAKLEGFTNGDIAARLGVSLRSVERKLGLIRKVWSDRGFA